MARLYLGSVLVECGLRLGVLVQHFGEELEVFEKIGVCQMATGEVGEESR